MESGGAQNPKRKRPAGAAAAAAPSVVRNPPIALVFKIFPRFFPPLPLFSLPSVFDFDHHITRRGRASKKSELLLCLLFLARKYSDTLEMACNKVARLSRFQRSPADVLARDAQEDNEAPVRTAQSWVHASLWTVPHAPCILAIEV